MGALTGNTVQSTYLDLVQLGKSGAGLPSHAGKEAALYDGAGYQIIGRSAVRHWLDPDPAAIAGTWEFSTYGNANQAALEAAGWTFTNCTASVANGFLTLVSNGSDLLKAELTVNLTGDFCYVVKALTKFTTPAAAYKFVTYFAVGDASNNGYAVSFTSSGSLLRIETDVSFTYGADVSGASTSLSAVAAYSDAIGVINRNSSTLFVGCGPMFGSWNVVDANSTSSFGLAGSTATTSETMTKFGFLAQDPTSGQTYYVPFIRRYA